jgi:hypothetical protein
MNKEELREVQLHKDNKGMKLLAILSYVEEPILSSENSRTCDIMIGDAVSKEEEILLILEDLAKRGYVSYKPISFYGFSKRHRKGILKEIEREYKKGNYKNLPGLFFQ